MNDSMLTVSSGVALMTGRAGFDEPLSVIADNLRLAARIMPTDRWQRVCLDTLVHVSEATTGFITNEHGSPVQVIGSDLVDAGRIASATKRVCPQEGLMQVHTGSKTYDVLLVPSGWPLLGCAGAVLAWEHPASCPVDAAELAESIHALFP